MKVFVKGLNSCPMRKGKLRQYADFLKANGHEVVATPEESENILLWTCAFRGDVRDNSIREIERYQGTYPSDVIVVGCLPDIDIDLLRRHFQGGVVYWKNDRQEMESFFGDTVPLNSFTPSFAEESVCDDAQVYRMANPDADVTFHDQFVKLLISEGCNYNCTYCSEKLALPPYRSFPPEELRAQCVAITERTGKKDVILLSDSLGDYGCDIGVDLPFLLRSLTAGGSGLRFALNNLNPEGFIRHFDRLMEIVRSGEVRHVNLPIQSGSDRILHLMERPYTRADVARIFGAFNDIGFKEFDTHILVGFPTETENDFRETIRVLEVHRPKYVLASAFMESPGMAAYGMEGKVDHGEKLRRLAIFDKAMKAAGVICNTDGSEISRERFRRLNKI